MINKFFKGQVFEKNDIWMILKKNYKIVFFLNLIFENFLNDPIKKKIK